MLVRQMNTCDRFKLQIPSPESRDTERWCNAIAVLIVSGTEANDALPHSNEIPVGVSLLAMAMCHSASVLDGRPSSRAGSRLQGVVFCLRGIQGTSIVRVLSFCLARTKFKIIAGAD